MLALILACAPDPVPPADSPPAPPAEPVLAQEGAPESAPTASVPWPPADIPLMSSCALAPYKGGDDAPLVVFGLHGYGSRGDQFCRVFDDLDDRYQVFCPNGPLLEGHAGYAWLPIESTEIWPSTQMVEAAVRACAHGRPTAVTGFSQGGMVTFDLVRNHPDAVDLAVPISGWSAPFEGAPVEHPPTIRALHGADDDLLLPGAMAASVQELADVGWPATFETFPGVAHRLSPPMRTSLLAALAEFAEAAARPSPGTAATP